MCEISANWESMMNNMNIGGTELGSEDEIADSDDDGRFKLFYSNQFNSIVFRKTITATGDFQSYLKFLGITEIFVCARWNFILRCFRESRHENPKVE